jgi:hypothetical protein
VQEIFMVCDRIRNGITSRPENGNGGGLIFGLSEKANNTYRLSEPPPEWMEAVGVEA